ncbi:MAG: hypothetical protein LBI48_01935 [Burkholderiaceae bacterium]|jgi:hypothetical protein|nr:hypothetical protein [Burkholderiaceae bacterium]
MAKRIWHKGPPPHIGWWNTSINRDESMWRWWNGKHWSCSVKTGDGVMSAAYAASVGTFYEMSSIEWTDYWPENARVPRIDPRINHD